jgi:hypothetical protein
MLKFSIVLIIGLLYIAPTVAGQGALPPKNVPIDIGKITPSNILDELRDIKRRFPRLSVRRLSQRANALIKKKGFNFTISVTRPDNVPADIYTLATRRGTQFTFQVDEPHGSPCHETVLNLPVRRINAKEIDLVSHGLAYTLKRPIEFESEEVSLVDRTLKKEVRKWAVPIDATPLGISRDGRKLYFGFDFPDTSYQHSLQLENLIYEISETGSIGFIPKNDPKIVKGDRLEIPNREDDFEYMRFRNGRKTFTIKFLGICT